MMPPNRPALATLRISMGVQNEAVHGKLIKPDHQATSFRSCFFEVRSIFLPSLTTSPQAVTG